MISLLMRVQIVLWYQILLPPLGNKCIFKEEVTYSLCCFCAKVRHFKDAVTVKLAILSIL